jgi:hypothetical protein
MECGGVSSVSKCVLYKSTPVFFKFAITVYHATLWVGNWFPYMLHMLREYCHGSVYSKISCQKCSFPVTFVLSLMRVYFKLFFVNH